MKNIPIYRAKKIDTDEYIQSMTISEGTIKRKRDLLFMEIGENKWIQVDRTTLAIHFPDMLDSQGNKIFASLSEDGKGGSILTDDEHEFTLYFDGRKYRIIGNEINSEINDYEEWNEFNVIGVQQ